MAHIKDLIVNGVGRVLSNLFVGGDITANGDVSGTDTSGNKISLRTLKSNFQAGVDGIYNAIVAQGTTPASKSQSDVQSAIGTMSTNRYNAGNTAGQATGKTNYEPKSATATNAGAVTVKNAAGTTVLTTSITNSYDAGVSATKVGTAGAGDVLSGKTFTNASSVGSTGTMTNNGAVSKSIGYGESYTVPAGYHNGSGKVTNSVGAGTITSGSAKITSETFTYNSTNGNFDVTGSATVSAPTIGTAGYVSSSTGTKNTNTATLATTVGKVAIKATNSGTTTVTPVISRVAKPSDDTWTDAASGAATTTKPTSGVYVEVQSAKNTGTLTATPSVTTAGYGTTTSGQYGATNATSTVGANASAATYVPIKGGSATTPTASAASTSTSLSGTTLTVARSVTPTISAGWVSSGTAGTVTITGTVPTQTKTVTPSTSSQTISPDSGKLLSSITVNAISTETQAIIPTKSTQTITATSGKYITSVTVEGVSVPAADKILSGYAVYSDYHILVEGTMKDCSGFSGSTLNCDQNITIPKGYHDGLGKIYANPLSSQTRATATADCILNGKTAWVNGSQITGTLSDANNTKY